MRLVTATLLLLLPLGAAADAALQNQVQRLTATVLEQEQKLQRLEADVRGLRGDMEVLSHQIGQASQTDRNLYADMDERLRKVEAGVSAAAVQTPAVTPSGGGTVEVLPPDFDAGDSVPSVPADSGAPELQPIPVSPADAPMPAASGDERSAYQSAFNLLQAGHYQQANSAFQGFLQQYPKGEYSDNAQYWLGESYYALRDYRSAQSAFEALIESYPTSQKRSHAELKLGYVYYELKDKVRAREILEQVRLHYPGTSTARLAEERLRRLQVEGY